MRRHRLGAGAPERMSLPYAGLRRSDRRRGPLIRFEGYDLSPSQRAHPATLTFYGNLAKSSTFVRRCGGAGQPAGGRKNCERAEQRRKPMPLRIHHAQASTARLMLMRQNRLADEPLLRRLDVLGNSPAGRAARKARASALTMSFSGVAQGIDRRNPSPRRESRVQGARV